MTAITKQHILITGANGFIGRNLCTFLKGKGYFVRGAVRNNVRDVSGVNEYIQVGDINELTDWQLALSVVDTVVHLAARVHIMNDSVANPVEAFRKVNVLGTERLARMAAKAGVKRFIFISSVKVNGEGALISYTEKDIPEPQDAYGVSKREAEDLLARIANEIGLQVVILRLPLVYGPGVKANFLSLFKIVDRGIPLPLASIKNQRSFIYLENLVDAIVTCITHPEAAGKTYLVSDGQDVSTPELIRLIAKAMGKKARLFSCPVSLLKMIGKVAGKSSEIERLTGSLQIDSAKIRRELNWTPPFTMEQGLRETAEWFKRRF